MCVLYGTLCVCLFAIDENEDCSSPGTLFTILLTGDVVNLQTPQPKGIRLVLETGRYKSK